MFKGIKILHKLEASNVNNNDNGDGIGIRNNGEFINVLKEVADKLYAPPSQSFSEKSSEDDATYDMPLLSSSMSRNVYRDSLTGYIKKSIFYSIVSICSFVLAYILVN